MLGFCSLPPAGFPYSSPTLQLTSCSPRPGRPASHSAVFWAPPGSRLPRFCADCLAGTVQGYLGWQTPKTSPNILSDLRHPFTPGLCSYGPSHWSILTSPCTDSHPKVASKATLSPHTCVKASAILSASSAVGQWYALGRGLETWGPIPASVCASRKMWD